MPETPFLIDLRDGGFLFENNVAISSDKSPMHQSCDMLFLWSLIQKPYIIPAQALQVT